MLGACHREPRWHNDSHSAVSCHSWGPNAGKCTVSCGLCYLEAGFPGWGSSFGHLGAVRTVPREEIRDGGPGTRGSVMPRMPQLDFLTFLVYCHQNSVCFSGSTLPTVGLSQGGLKVEVTVTRYARIRHVGPMPEWPSSSMESRDRAGVLEERPCPPAPTSAPAQCLVPRACWCSVQDCCMKEAMME